jgi:hypothetical protein
MNFPIDLFAKANTFPIDLFAKANTFPIDLFAKANTFPIDLFAKANKKPNQSKTNSAFQLVLSDVTKCCKQSL